MEKFWWVEYMEEGIRFTPGKKPIYSEHKPEGNYWGGFHCPECASSCVSFGMTEERAYLRNHGTDDERQWA